jgi:uncharacterized glyoxalase superfamily protein PhnB
MTGFHATLISDKMVETVNFYEDFFNFAPVIEQERYVLMFKKDDPSLRIAVFDSAHPCVYTVAPAQGVILNLWSHDVKALYDELYMEGLEMYKEFGTDVHGNSHFVVIDPNGVLINVCEPVEIKIPELELEMA